jgi:competence protein ComEC
LSWWPERPLGFLTSHPLHAPLAGLAVGLAVAGAGVAPAPVWSGVLGAAALVAAAQLVRRGAREQGDVGEGGLLSLGRGTALAVALVTALLAAGMALGTARLAALDGALSAPVAGTRVDGRAVLLERPRPGRFGGVAAVELVTGAEREPRLLARGSADAPLVPTLAPGTLLDLRGSVGDLPPRSGWAAHMRRRGVAAELHLDGVRPTGLRRGGWSGLVDEVRARAEAGLRVRLGPTEAALAHGMVLGRDEGIPERVREDFRRAGLAHLLAVSGQNVMLLVLLALPLLAAIGLGLRTRLWVAIALVALYVPLAGAGPSLQRAAVMGAAGLLALLASRPASRWYGLGLAAAATLTANPRMVGEPGWQLSFAAVAGILLVPARGGPQVSSGSSLAGRVLAAGVDGARLTLAAGLATAPLLAFHFGGVSLAGLPANLLALPAVAPVMWTGMLQAALGQAAALPLIGWPASGAIAILSLPAEAGLRYLGWVARRLAEAPGAVLDAPLRSPATVLAAYAGLAAGALCLRALAWATRSADGRGWWARLPRAGRAAAVAGAAAASTLVVSRWLGPGPPPDRLTVSFLDVGQGDATLVQHPDGSAVLFDGGPPEGRVDGLLRRAGVRRLSLLVATHASRDHHGGLEEVVERYPVHVVLDGGDGTDDQDFRRFLTAARRRGVQSVPAAAGQVLRAGGLVVRVLGPPPRPPGPPPEDPNPRAVAAVVSAGGFDLFLAGDAESEALAGLALPDVEAMKVSHHGSADPGLPRLLERLRPEVAAIEVGGDNSYGHPAPETLAALNAAGARVLRTDRHGTVRIQVGEGGMAVTTGR